jgi:hypothetical protein
MPFQSTRAKLVLSAEVESRLKMLAHSRTEPAQRVERAQILLAYVRIPPKATTCSGEGDHLPERSDEQRLMVG